MVIISGLFCIRERSTTRPSSGKSCLASTRRTLPIINLTGEEEASGSGTATDASRLEPSHSFLPLSLSLFLSAALAMTVDSEGLGA